MICLAAVSLEEDSTSDVLWLGSVEEITSPNRGTSTRYSALNYFSFTEICICCGSFKVHTQHPLFHGGICSLCTENFLETFFLYDDDGLQSYCTICCSGKILLMCDEPTCNRGYCFKCLDVLVSPGTAEKVKAMNTWLCFMCLPLSSHGLLQKKQRWRTKLKCFYDQESNHFKIYRPVPAWDRKPISILSLFDNITPGKLLPFQCKALSEYEHFKKQKVLKSVQFHQVKEWGPFDFIFGSTPPVGNSYDHPPAWYFYQYYQILQYGKPLENSERPFFWMFVDNLVLTEEDRDTASRFFKVHRKCISSPHNCCSLLSSLLLIIIIIFLLCV
uniref:DNA methyltransferase 3 like n=1 Tax=Crocodylus porosus TaxID=8502 RepID=A0A7M4FEQ8_CROPO